jgi:hypothetical protein
MKTPNLQEIYEAVGAMQQLIASLGVQIPQPLTVVRKHAPARQFAEDILNDPRRDRVAEMTRAHPEPAQAFLFLLWQIREELKGTVTSPDNTATESEEAYHLAGYAVVCKTVADSNRRPFVTALGQ